MGGDLSAAPRGKSPSFLVAAMKDPFSGNLDRIQIVKGWIDKDGKTQEKVYDVVWSGDRKPGANGKLPPVGKCSLDPAHDRDDAEGFRCPWAHPLAQRFRIWQEVRNLAVAETGKNPRRLTKEQGDRVALALFQNAKLSFDKIRSLLKLPSEAHFNLESERRGELLGDRVTSLRARRAMVRIERFATPAEFREYFKTCYGPTVAVARSLEGDADRMRAYDAALDGVAGAAMDASGAMDWEYLLVTARRSG